MSLGECVPRVKPLRSSETSEPTHPTTRRHIPEDLNPQQDRYENLLCRIVHTVCGKFPTRNEDQMKIIAFKPFKSDVHVVYSTSVPTSQRTQISPITKADRSMLFRKTIAAYRVTQGTIHVYIQIHSYHLCGADISQSYSSISVFQFLRIRSPINLSNHNS